MNKVYPVLLLTLFIGACSSNGMEHGSGSMMKSEMPMSSSDGDSMKMKKESSTDSMSHNTMMKQKGEM